MQIFKKIENQFLINYFVERKNNTRTLSQISTLL